MEPLLQDFYARDPIAVARELLGKIVLRQTPEGLIYGIMMLQEKVKRERMSDETIRNTLKRLGIQWKRAKRWITSPDPAYKRKKTTETD